MPLPFCQVALVAAWALWLCVHVQAQAPPDPLGIQIPGLQKNVTPEVFAQAASGGADFHAPTAQITYQGSQIADNWTSTPKCISVYLDAPSWSHYNMSLSIQLQDPNWGNLTCLNERVKWKAVVQGVDFLPRQLATAVGYDVMSWTTNYTATARYQINPLGLKDLPYTELPPRRVPNNPDLQQELANKIAACKVEHPTWSIQQCVTGAPVPQLALPPLPPAPPTPPAAGDVTDQTRRSFRLSPGKRDPWHLTSYWPYRYDSGSENATVSEPGYHTYVEPLDMCQIAFSNTQFETLSPSEESRRELDSCYYTQIVVYLYYDGSCWTDPTTKFGVNIQVDAHYSDYLGCQDSWLFTFTDALMVVVTVLGVPVAVFIAYLAFPTAWRMIYRGTLGWVLSSSTPADIKRQYQFRVQADMPMRWPCLLWFQQLPGMRHMIMCRKKLLYACLTIQKPHGRRRLLMVMIIASCATSVSSMVWKPQLDIVLNRNPIFIVFSLEETPGFYGELIRYIKIAAFSLFLGVLAYLSMLTTTNMPDEEDVKRRVIRMYHLPDLGPGSKNTQQSLSDSSSHLHLSGAGRKRDKKQRIYEWAQSLPISKDEWTAWEIQRSISIFFSFYMVAFLLLQMANLAVFIPSQEDKAAGIWILATQAINIIMVVVLQAYDLTVVNYEACVKYLGDDAPKLRGVIGHIVRFLWFCSGKNRRHVTEGGVPFLEDTLMIPPVPSLWSRSSVKERKTATAAADIEQGLNFNPKVSPVVEDVVKPQRQNFKKRRFRKNFLLHWWRDDDRLREKTGDRKKDKAVWRAMEEAEEQLTVFQQIRIIIREAFLEESIQIRLNDRMVKARTFRYPAWFLASVLVASYMLVFHYIRSIRFGKKLGYCFLSPTQCEIQWLYSLLAPPFDQMAVIRSIALSAQDQLQAYNAFETTINAVAGSATGQPLTLGDLQSLIDDIAQKSQPDGTPAGQRMQAFGAHMMKTSVIGYTLGFVLGILTLITAVQSFKRISKANRLLRVSRRIMAAKRMEAHAEPSPNLLVRQSTQRTRSTGGVAPDPDVTTTVAITGVAHLLEGTRAKMKAARTTSMSRMYSDDVSMPVVHLSTVTAQPDKQKEVDLEKYEVSDDDDDFAFETEEKVEEPELSSSTLLAAVRACNVDIGIVVFFLGVLLSAMVVQLYTVGIVLSVLISILQDPGFDQWARMAWPYVIVALGVFLFNKYIVAATIGNKYLSNGKRIKRPAGWMAFMIIASITNLIVGFFIAIVRLIWLLLTSVFAVGLLDRTILTVGGVLDLSHNSFLAGINLQDGGGKVDARAFKPGPLWRATRRWQAAVRQIIRLKQKGSDELVARNIKAGRVSAHEVELLTANQGKFSPPVHQTIHNSSTFKYTSAFQNNPSGQSHTKTHNQYGNGYGKPAPSGFHHVQPNSNKQHVEPLIDPPHSSGGSVQNRLNERLLKGHHHEQQPGSNRSTPSPPARTPPAAAAAYPGATPAARQSASPPTWASPGPAAQAGAVAAAGHSPGAPSASAWAAIRAGQMPPRPPANSAFNAQVPASKTPASDLLR